MAEKRGDDGNYSDLEEEDIDEELQLPDTLAELRLGEKKEMLRFKRTHNEIDWEEEVLRRSDLLARKIDMERLKRMTKGSTAEKKTETRSSSSGKGKAAKRRKIDSDSEEEDEDDADEDEEFEEIKKGQDEEDDEDEDDLFDSDEEEEMMKKTRPGSTAPKLAVTAAESSSGKGKSSRRSSRLATALDDDDDEDDSDGEEMDEDEELFGEDGMPLEGGESDLSKIKRKAKGTVSTKKSLEDEAKLAGEMEIAPPVNDTSPLASLDFVLRIQTRRFSVEKWVSEPFLKKALIGTFVRFLIGNNDSNQGIYRMCEIIDVTNSAKTYKNPGLNKLINTRLTLSIGGAIKENNRINEVSNSRISQIEYDYFTKSLEKPSARDAFGEDPLKLTELQVIYRRKKHIQAVNYTYTHTDIQNMVQRNYQGNKATVTDFTTALELLNKKRDAALRDETLSAEEKRDVVDNINKQLESMLLSQALMKEKFAAATKSSLAVNQRNRENNIKRDIDAGKRKRAQELIDRSQQKTSATVADPFIRRDTRPKILWNTGSQMTALIDADKDYPAGETAPKEVLAAAAAGAAAAAIANAAAHAAAAKAAAAAEEAANADASTIAANAAAAAAAALARKEAPLKGGGTNAALDMIRKRVRARLGVDPYEIAQESARTRYLHKFCVDLPPLGSAERKALLGEKGKTLQEGQREVL